jgi:hypothetical protein
VTALNAKIRAGASGRPHLRIWGIEAGKPLARSCTGHFRLLATILCAFLVAGCVSGAKSTPKTYPEKAEAKRLIESKGIRLARDVNPDVDLVPAAGAIKGRWYWNAAEYGGRPVCELAMPDLIRVASRDGGYQHDALLHGYGHVWMERNFDDYGHDPRLRDVFANWRDSGYPVAPTKLTGAAVRPVAVDFTEAAP